MSDSQPDAGIDAAVLDRVTNTLIILQVKSASADRGKVIAALQTLRGRMPDGAQLILVEGESEARLVREQLLAIEQTSLGAPEARRARAKATAGRVAEILIRHEQAAGPLDADKAAQSGVPDVSGRQVAGEVPGFELWFRMIGGEILQRSYFYARDPVLAQDIAQAAAIKLHKAWADEETRSKILTSSAYRGAIVKDCFLDHSLNRVLGNIKARPDEAQLNDGPHPPANSGDDEDLRLAVFSLEDNEQEMIIFVYYHDLPIREAGRQLGLTASQAYRLHAKALARMTGLVGNGKPDPLRARTPAELNQVLREYRAWAGDPSFRKMSDRCGGTLAKSTLFNALNNTDTLPALKVVTAIVTGCGGSEEDIQRFASAWRAIQAPDATGQQGSPGGQPRRLHSVTGTTERPAS